MDRTLNRAEAKELMELLDLHMSAWGNMPLLRKKYLEKCKEYHPDKGGDETKMKRLNTLYRKLEEKVHIVHEEARFEAWDSNKVPTYGTREWDMWWEQFNRAWEEEQIRRDREEREKRRKQPNRDSQQSQQDSAYFTQEPGTSSQGTSQGTSQGPTCEEDLHCDEEFFDEPFEEEPPSNSQATPPKKNKNDIPNFPEHLLEFVSQALFSNRTMTCFIIHTTMDKANNLYKKLIVKFKCTFCSKHSYGDTGLVFMITPGKHRVSAINNYCKAFCTVSFLYCKGVNNPYLCYSRLCDEPFKKVEESIPGGLRDNDFQAEDIFGEASEQINWKQIAEYAQVTRQEDVFLLMGHYMQFASEPHDCQLCTEQKVKDHYKYHTAHHRNASLFVECKNQKNICQQAVDTVIAKKRVFQQHKTREELVLIRFKEKLEDLNERLKGEDDFWLYMAGVAWYTCMFEDIDLKVYKILDILTCNVPKRRYVVFKGPINSGKTTLGSAILDLLGGKSLNVNVPADKLNFELGCAIDQFMVLFEDVKGSNKDNPDLPKGQGIYNLDNLRDFLDGCVPVNLEKKHMNKRSQIFPPGIVTMNDYYIPPTLQARFCKTIQFSVKPHLKASLSKTKELLYDRVLQKGITILLVLIWHRPVADFHEAIQEKVVYWKECIEKYVSPTDFGEMCLNIEQGNKILK
ncbi:large T antigen [Betapolyomavirus securanorvegicus]|uniref:Large T antigen n=1 Tax=Betapolyomavirus securanorvegicus TaxID=1919247 RepID=A0A2Z2DSM2_9POLY|nr:large T antigen [Betapolyomavirus securanorvegicus]API13110.1 large T antigen [Betapolyomavirus securanorvegicus]